MNALPVSPFLKGVLLADALATALSAVVMALAASALAEILRLPATLLFTAGLVLLPYAAAVGYLATRDRLQPRAVWTVIVCNVLWAIDCAVLAFSGWVTPSMLGYAFILAQVIVVIAFAELQYVGLRRSAVSDAAWAR
jgi:hypothetical protein